MSTKEFTGRKMLVLTVSAFTVIIGVNLLLAYKAVATFPGLETKNSYVASQNFNADKKAQEALGWTIEADEEGDQFILYIRDRDGNPVEVAELSGTLGRATSVRDDQTPVFTFDGTAYRAPARLGAGNWNFRMVAKAKDGTRFRQRVVIHIKR